MFFNTFTVRVICKNAPARAAFTADWTDRRSGFKTRTNHDAALALNFAEQNRALKDSIVSIALIARNANPRRAKVLDRAPGTFAIRCTIATLRITVARFLSEFSSLVDHVRADRVKPVVVGRLCRDDHQHNGKRILMQGRPIRNTFPDTPKLCVGKFWEIRAVDIALSRGPKQHLTTDTGLTKEYAFRRVDERIGCRRCKHEASDQSISR